METGKIILMRKLIGLFLCFLLLPSVFARSFEQKYSIIVTGEYDNRFTGGMIRSEQELDAFKKLTKVAATIPEVNFNKYMWVYSPWEIADYTYFKQSGMLSLTPVQEKNNDGKTIYMLCISKIQASLNYTAPFEDDNERKRRGKTSSWVRL